MRAFIKYRILTYYTQGSFVMQVFRGHEILVKSKGMSYNDPMPSKSPKNNQYSAKILRVLEQRTAISLPDLKEAIRGEKYAVTRSLKGLREAGLVEQISTSQNEYARLTKEGRKKAHSLKLETETALLNPTWDGYWRIILLDLPENRKSERESLRYLLKKAGFVCLKNSAWISPFPYEHLFTNIKKDLGLTTEMMILVTNQIDEESRKSLFESFGN